MDYQGLSCAVNSHTRLCAIVKGVCPIEELPNEVSVYPSAYIVCTTPPNTEKKHWIVMWFGENGDAEFFDSYGCNPRRYGLESYLDENSLKCICNRRTLQHGHTQVSGQYCLYYLHCKSQGLSMRNIKDQFGLDRVENDLKVHSFVETSFSNFKHDVEQEGGKRTGAALHSPPKRKRVTFAPEPNLVTIHEWIDDGKAFRKSQWMTVALDRARFEHRIQKTQRCIGYIFTPLHRTWWMSKFVQK